MEIRVACVGEKTQKIGEEGRQKREWQGNLNIKKRKKKEMRRKPTGKNRKKKQVGTIREVGKEFHQGE